ncbi:MAG: CPBP family intramembrane glutamic endopeptidase [Janthinobacterium lividum]
MKGLPPRPVHPFLQLLLLVALAVAGLSLGYFVALAVVLGGYGVSLAQFQDLSLHPGRYPQAWPVLMLVQGMALAGVGAGALLLPLVLRQPVAGYFAPRRLGAAWWPLAAGLLILCLVPALSGVVAWNAGVHFPAALHDFEVWARGLEDQAADLTKFLTNFSTPGRLLGGLLAIAVVPAVAEELVFRGVFQPNLQRWFGSRQVGIWLTAATFSAIHFQFFGFVPRFLLGLVLGYLYEWSGNILVPMAAHFTQNAFQLILLYLAQGRHLPSSFDPDANQSLPWPTILVSAGLSAVLLYALHQRMTAAAPAEAPAAGVSPPSL